MAVQVLWSSRWLEECFYALCSFLVPGFVFQFPGSDPGKIRIALHGFQEKGQPLIAGYQGIRMN